MNSALLLRRPLRRGLGAAFATAALAVAAVGCASSPASSSHLGSTNSSTTAGMAFPVTISAPGGPVRIGKRPGAIVSLSPTATEMLYSIGAGPQVKAVDMDSNYPPSVPRTKLSAYTPNIEAIVALHPDLVVTFTGAPALAKSLAPYSIPVLNLPPAATVGDVYTQFTQLGRATGHVAAAVAEVRSVRAQVSQIVAAMPRRAKALTYYWELDQTFYSVTSKTFIGRLLGLLGMKSIADAAKGAAAAGGYPQLSAEYIVKANPDFVILADTQCCHQNAATVRARPGWSGLAAVRSGHVLALNDDIASRWGPRITDLLRAVMTAIRGGR